MKELIIVTCVITLLGAAVLEIAVAQHSNRSGLSSLLMASGCVWLAGRMIYLVTMGDTGRLSVWGTMPIVLMAFARVVACSIQIRKGI